jgi:putative SOS response-associated peptidase YedK
LRFQTEVVVNSVLEALLTTKVSTINARAETIATSRTWREPMKKRRCLIPVNAFYEWPKEGKPPKQPYAFDFAGVWDAWKDGEGHWLQSYAIVTTEANELMSRIHPRMPRHCAFAGL